MTSRWWEPPRPVHVHQTGQLLHKDTDEIFVERIEFDKKILQANRIKALRILKSNEPLTKVGDSDECFSCRWCDFKSICHENSVPPVTCRSCVHVTPILEGDGARWRCERHKTERTRKEQFEACEDHLYIPALIPYSEPVDSGDDWIAYQVKGRDQRFVNAGPTSFPAQDVPHYLSSEIAALPSPDVIGNEAIERVRDTFDAKIVASSEEVAHVI